MPWEMLARIVFMPCVFYSTSIKWYNDLKRQLSKQDLTIPKLELVACHLSVNLIDNANKTLTGHPACQLVPSADGSAALYWIRGKSNYK